MPAGDDREPAVRLAESAWGSIERARNGRGATRIAGGCAVTELQGRVAVVTGGASGVGSGLCRGFAAAGLAVVVADIDAAGAEGLAAELRDGGARALAVGVDVTEPESVEALARRTVDELGGVHIVCNNAGVIVGGPVQDATEEDWRWLLAVNLGGVINGCRAFVPHLRQHGPGGHIVNTASVGGFLATPGLAIYCTSKYAVIGFSEALRQERAPEGIGVSVLCPGNVRTNLLEADRNRPDALAPSGGRAVVLRDAIDSGVDPVELAEPVLRGIRDNAAYIFTHAEYREIIEKRFRGVLDAFDP